MPDIDTYAARITGGWLPRDGYWWRPLSPASCSWDHEPMTDDEMATHKALTRTELTP